MELKQVLITNREISNKKMIRDKTDMMYDAPEFKEIIKLGKMIQYHEIKCLLGFIGFTGFTVSMLTLTILFTGFLPLMFLYGIAVAVPLVLCFPQVTYQRFFKEIYLPICYHCANIMDKKDDLSFKLKDKKNIKPVIMGGKEVTNTFHIKTGDSEAVVRRLVIRDRIPTYNMYKGRLMISSKMATIFSGYSFEMQMNPLINEQQEDEEILITLINNSTFYKQHGLSSEELEKLQVVPFKFRQLNDFCTLYTHKDYTLNNNIQYNLEKKIMSFTRELGDFSVYISKNRVRILMNVQNNREGLEVEFFKTSLKHSSGLSYNGFFSMVKTLYILSCIERLMDTIFGKERSKFKTFNMK